MAITERQRQARNEGVGASEVAALLGLDPFKSAADILAVKMGMVEPGIYVPSEAAEIGTFLEDGIAQLVSRRLGKSLVKPTGTYKHDGGILFANLDRQVERAARGMPPVEIKDTSRVEEWKPQEGGESITECIPLRVLLQVQTQMVCSGASESYVGVLLSGFGRKTIGVYHVPHMPEITGPMIEGIEKLWKKHIVNREPLDDSLGVMSDGVLKRIEPEPGKVQQVDEAEVSEWLLADARAEAAQAVADDLYARIKTRIGDAEAGVGPFGMIAVKQVRMKQFDKEALAAAHPDLVEKFTTTTTYKRYTKKINKEWKNTHVVSVLEADLRSE